MDEFLGLSGVTWTGIGAIAGAASLVVASVIAVIVHRGAKRADGASRRVALSIEELTRCSRRDDLLQQLRVEWDPVHLELLIDEARVMSAGRPAERLGLEKAYFTNPSAPLLQYSHQIPPGLRDGSYRALFGAVVESLPARYADELCPPSRMAASFAHLTRFGVHLGAPTNKIAEFLISRSSDGWLLADRTVRTILHAEYGVACQPNMEAASDYLYALQHEDVSVPTLVNVVAGVSLAICDSHRLKSDCEPADAYTAYIMLMQRNLVGIGLERDAPGMTISVDHAVAVMVNAMGLVAGGDAHLNKRALEALNPILGSFDTLRFTSTGIVADSFAAGVQRLLRTNAPEKLRIRLREEALRLVPSTEDERAFDEQPRGIF